MQNYIKLGSLVINLLLAALLILSFYVIYKLNSEDSNSNSGLSQQRLLHIVEYYEKLVVVDYISDRLIGSQFPRIATTDINGNQISTDIVTAHNNKPQRQGALILVFNLGGCQPCLTSQMKILNHAYNLLDDSDQFQIIAFAKAEGQLYNIKRMVLKYKLRFPFVVDSDHQFFNTQNSSLYEKTPIVFLIDQDNRIVQCHIPLFKRPIISALFYREIQRFMPLKTPLFNMYFEHINLTDILRENFDTKPISDLVY